MISPSSITRSVLSAACVVFALVPIVQGQQGMRLQFMTFPQTMEPLEVELVTGKDKTVKIKVPSNELSETVRVPRMSSLIFGETVLDAEDKPSFKIFGQGKPTASPKQLVLLLRKGKNMSDGFTVRTISSDMDAFDGGKLLFVNAAKVMIGGRVGHKPFALKPGAQSILKPKLEKNGRLTYVELFYRLDGKAIPFFNSMWPVAKNNRGLVFFYHDPQNQNKVRFHSFRDFLPVNN